MRTLLMWLLMGGLVAGHAVVSQVGGPPQAPPRDLKSEPQTGTASIQGRITALDTGIPLRRALVNLGGLRQARAMYTDDEGRYTFTRLPAGNYTIFANPGPHRGAYQPASYGGAAAAILTRGKSILLAEGQKVEGIDVALPRTSAISGRVTDAAGEPASRVQVQALMQRAGGEQSVTGSASTNDLGEFRIFHLLPGDYVLMASPPLHGGGPEVEGEAIGFAPSYSPGVPTIGDATRVRLGRGTQATADIRLIETRVYSVSGTVMTASGEPSRGGSVSVLSRDSSFGSMFSTGVSGTGTFALRNIPPGSYELISTQQASRAPGAPPSTAPASQEFGSVRIDVTGDTEHVLIPMTTGAVVTGELIFDEPLPPGGRVNITPMPGETRSYSGMPRVEVSGAQFTLRGVFGSLLLRGNASGGSLPWTLKAVLLRDKDITDEPTALTAADSGHLRVVFTSRAPSLEGSVIGEDGQPAPDATIVLFGQDETTWRPRHSFNRNVSVGKDGKFVARGLREGRYYAAAIPLEVMANVGQPTPEFLKNLSDVATAVTLNAGEIRSLDLRLVRFEQ